MNAKELFIIKKHNLIELLATIVVWLAFMKDAISASSHIVLTGLGVAFGSILLAICISSFKISRRVLHLWLLAALLGGANIAVVGSLTLQNYIPMLLLYFPIAIYFVYSPSANERWWEINYFLYSAYVIFRMLTARGGYYMFYAASRNALSVLLLIWLFFLYNVYRKAGKVLPIRDVVLFFVGCVIATGRGGIISGFVLIVCFWLLDLRENALHRNWKYQSRWLSLVVVAIVAFVYASRNMESIMSQYLFRFSDTASLRSSNARIEAWELYINECKNFWVFLFGGNTNRLLPESYAGNLHNSVLMMHARFGIAGFLYSLFIFFSAVILAIKKKEYHMGALIIVFFIRAMTDQLFPAKIGDIALWIVIFYRLKWKRSKIKGENRYLNSIVNTKHTKSNILEK